MLALIYNVVRFLLFFKLPCKHEWTAFSHIVNTYHYRRNSMEPMRGTTIVELSRTCKLCGKDDTREHKTKETFNWRAHKQQLALLSDKIYHVYGIDIHEDVLSGVLDIGWVYRHSKCFIVECGAVFSVGDQITTGGVKPATLMIPMEDMNKVLPSMDFFLVPSKEKLLVTFNLNDYVWVRLTEHALKILEENLAESCLPENMEELVRSKWVPDEEGYVMFQMWELCREFGQHMYNGCKQLFVDNLISITTSEVCDA